MPAKMDPSALGERWGLLPQVCWQEFEGQHTPAAARGGKQEQAGQAAAEH